MKKKLSPILMQFRKRLNVSSCCYLGPSKKRSKKTTHSNKIILARQYGAPHPHSHASHYHLCEECAQIICLESAFNYLVIYFAM